MKQEIYELTRRLREQVLNSPNPEETLRQILEQYGTQVADIITNSLQNNFGNPLALTVPAVVDMIQPQLVIGPYKHASQAIDNYLQNKRTINEMAMDPAGMGVDKSLVSLPKRITGPTVDKLKNLPLKQSYLDLLNARNKKEYEKALKWAFEAKARYLALRIADTEEAKAFTYNRMKKYLEQDVEYVQWRFSSKHKDGCICDYYRYNDEGYGPGIYKAKDAPLPVFSTHPHCRCRLVPFRKPVSQHTPSTQPRPDEGFPEVRTQDMFDV